MGIARYKELMSGTKKYSGRTLDKQVLSAIDAEMKKRPYRADLKISAASKYGSDGLSLKVRYHAPLGNPSEEDLMALTAESFEGYDIDWDTALVDPATGTIVLNLEQSVESIPLGSIRDIPSEFVSVGSGYYKRAADASGNVLEVWSLKKTDDGLALIRNMDDMEITAEEDPEVAAGALVDTPYGPGKVLRFDDAGNAFVQVGNKTRLVAKGDVALYNRNTDKKKLQDFYTQIYGPEFAKSLVEDFGRKQ